MRESVTYQMIVEEGIERGIERGEILGRRHSLIELGTLKFGQPPAATESALEGVATLDQLRRLNQAVLTAESWDELLASL